MSEDLSIAAQRNAILERINVAAKGRAGPSPTLVAVSKMQPNDRVADMLVTGHRIFGENRVQEAERRWAQDFKDQRQDIELRLIGPLQSNKAETAARLFDVIETLDRESLVKALVKAADKIGKLPRLLVQVNTGEEPQKAGIHPLEVPVFLKRLKTEYTIEPEGLMCIPPVNEAASPHFWLLSNMAKEQGLKVMSMGMSGDFETAIKMDATHVRVGSALFGPRPVAKHA